MNDDQISAHLRNLSNEEFLNAFADNETLFCPFAAEMRRRINEDLVVAAITVSDLHRMIAPLAPVAKNVNLRWVNEPIIKSY